MTPEEYLAEWAKGYLKYKDAVQRRIIGIEQSGNRITVAYKEKKATYIASASIDTTGTLENESTIVTFNTKENFQLVLKQWDEFVKKKITIILINPLSKLDDKWVVAAHVHSMICEKATFKQGLKTMSEMVEPISSTQIEELCRQK